MVTLLNLASPEPSCRGRNGYKYNIYVCEEFTSPLDFGRYVDRNELQQESHFILNNSHFDHLPSDAFRGVNISVLEFKNVRIDKFVDPSGPINPFSDLQQSLRQLVFLNRSSIPSSWSVLQGLDHLEILQLFIIPRLNLTRDFNNLPSSIKELHIVGSIIGTVDDDWIAGLRNLEVLLMTETTLNNLTRSMLPTPGPNLVTLDLPYGACHPFLEFTCRFFSCCRFGIH